MNTTATTPPPVTPTMVAPMVQRVARLEVLRRTDRAAERVEKAAWRRLVTNLAAAAVGFLVGQR